MTGVVEEVDKKPHLREKRSDFYIDFWSFMTLLLIVFQYIGQKDH